MRVQEHPANPTADLTMQLDGGDDLFSLRLPLLLQLLLLLLLLRYYYYYYYA